MCWVQFQKCNTVPTWWPRSRQGTTARMVVFYNRYCSSLGFRLEVLGLLTLNARILTKCSETTLLKAVCFCILNVIKKIEYNNSKPSVVIEVEVKFVKSVISVHAFQLHTTLCSLACTVGASAVLPLYVNKFSLQWEWKIPTFPHTNRNKKRITFSCNNLPWHKKYYILLTASL